MLKPKQNYLSKTLEHSRSKKRPSSSAKTAVAFRASETIKGNVHEHLKTVRLPEFITCYQVPLTVNKSLNLEDNYQPCILSQSCSYQSNYKLRVRLAFYFIKHTHTSSHTNPFSKMFAKSVCSNQTKSTAWERIWPSPKADFLVDVRSKIFLKHGPLFRAFFLKRLLIEMCFVGTVLVFNYFPFTFRPEIW